MLWQIKAWFECRLRQWFPEEEQKEVHIQRAIRSRKAQVYLEIGVRRGECFRSIDCAKKIGVDPNRQGFSPQPPKEEFFEMTSDEFFAEKAKTVVGDTGIDVALIDGMHEFGQVLRDLQNIEPYLNPEGVVLIHDCNPPDRSHAEVRDGSAWNGDVWKIACYLRAHRPGIHFFTLDCDYGVGVLSRFPETPPVVSKGAEQTCKTLDYSVLENDREELLNLKLPVWSRCFFRSLS